MLDDTILVFDFGHILGIVYRIMHEVCAPAITPFGASEVDGIASLNLTDIDAVVLIDRVNVSLTFNIQLLTFNFRNYTFNATSTFTADADKARRTKDKYQEQKSQ